MVSAGALEMMGGIVGPLAEALGPDTEVVPHDLSKLPNRLSPSRANSLDAPVVARPLTCSYSISGRVDPITLCGTGPRVETDDSYAAQRSS